MTEAKKTTQYFWLSEVIEDVEVIEVIEVIIADGANETTEVIRFSKELEFNNLMARIILF